MSQARTDNNHDQTRFIFEVDSPEMAELAALIEARFGFAFDDEPPKIEIGGLHQRRQRVEEARLNFVCFNSVESRGGAPSICITYAVENPDDAIKWVLSRAERVGVVATALSEELRVAGPLIKFVRLGDQPWAFAFRSKAMPVVPEQQ